MSENTDNIELRSDKVRNIIGQIPPRIIRVGITVIFLIVIGFLTGSYFFEYEYTVKTTALIEQSGDTTKIQVKVPANEIEKVKPGQKVVLSFDNIPNIFNEKSSVYIQSIPEKIYIATHDAFYYAVIIKSGKIKTLNGNELHLKGKIEVKAEIVCGKIRFFDKITGPVTKLLHKKNS